MRTTSVCGALESSSSMRAAGVRRSNLSELLISSRITMSYSPEVSTSLAFSRPALVLSRSSSRDTSFPHIWSAPMGIMVNPRVLSAAMCSP